MNAARNPAISMKIGAFVCRKFDVYYDAVSMRFEVVPELELDVFACEFDVNDTVCSELRNVSI